MEKLTGMEKKDVVGKCAIDIFPHLKEQGVDKLLNRALTGETATSPDTEYRCPQTGKTGWVVGTYTPHRNNMGQIIGVIGTIRDITERKQTENFLKEGEIMFRELFEHMSSAVAIYEPENDGEDFIFKNCNEALLRIEKISREQVIGSNGYITLEMPSVFRSVYTRTREYPAGEKIMSINYPAGK
jgi:PAS domain S-box-containing protein